MYVAVDPATPASILGFYTLSTSAIELISLPESQARKLPKHPLPAALLGRLAVSRSRQRTGLGRLLLANAIRRTLAVSDQIGIYAILVDAIDEDARGFYHHYGFVSMQSQGHRLFLPLKSI